MLVGKELHDYLDAQGANGCYKTHTDGLMSCYSCTMIVVTGKTKTELGSDCKRICKQVEKDIAGDIILSDTTRTILLIVAGLFLMVGLIKFGIL